MDRIVNDFGHWLGRLFDFSDNSIGLLKLAAVSFGVFTSYVLKGEPEMDAFVGASCLVLVDTMSGYWAAVVAKEPRPSKKLARVVTKVVGYLCVVIVASVAEHTVAKTVPVVVGCCWLMIATEGYSILENVEKTGLGRFRALRKILGRVIEDDKEKGKK